MISKKKSIRSNLRNVDADNNGCSTDCPGEKQFRTFFDGIKHIVVNVDENGGTENAETYHKLLINKGQLKIIGNIIYQLPSSLICLVLIDLLMFYFGFLKGLRQLPAKFSTKNNKNCFVKKNYFVKNDGNDASKDRSESNFMTDSPKYFDTRNFFDIFAI